MADVRENINAEFENISNVLACIPPASALPDLSQLEMAGVSTFLHNFYNGVENILKQGLAAKSVEIPSGATWHRDVLNAGRSAGLISAETMASLAPYLAFRQSRVCHRPRSGQAFDLG